MQRTRAGLIVAVGVHACDQKRTNALDVLVCHCDNEWRRTVDVAFIFQIRVLELWRNPLNSSMERGSVASLRQPPDARVLVRVSAVPHGSCGGDEA